MGVGPIDPQVRGPGECVVARNSALAGSGTRAARKGGQPGHSPGMAHRLLVGQLRPSEGEDPEPGRGLAPARKASASGGEGTGKGQWICRGASNVPLDWIMRSKCFLKAVVMCRGALSSCLVFQRLSASPPLLGRGDKEAVFSPSAWVCSAAEELVSPNPSGTFTSCVTAEESLNLS